MCVVACACVCVRLFVCACAGMIRIARAVVIVTVVDHPPNTLPHTRWQRPPFLIRASREVGPPPPPGESPGFLAEVVFHELASAFILSPARRHEVC